MTRIVIAFLILTLLVSCSERSNKRTFGFLPDQNTVIKFEIRNITESHVYTLLYNQTLPVGQTRQQIEINSDSLFYLNIKLNHPLYMVLIEKLRGINFFVIPGDTLSVNIDYKENKPLIDLVQFKGETGEISDYLAHLRNRFDSGLPGKEQSPEAFNHIIDSLYAIELIVIDSLLSFDKLPAWFVDIEKENIQHERDDCKFKQYKKRVLKYNQFIPKSDEFIESFNIRNMSNYWLESTFSLLSDLHHNKYDSLLQIQYANNEIFLEYLQNNIDFVEKRVSDLLLSYFVASKISSLFTKNKLLKLTPSEFEHYSSKIDSFISKNSHLISDSMLLAFVIDEKNKKYNEYQNQNLLKANEPAPGFYLSNIRGAYNKLSDFKGKVVLINFWATYCAPCINSIPEKNELLEYYSDKDFELINICIDPNEEAWKRIINENGFKGTHLICKGKWSEQLTTAYSIYGVPHYTLIDKNEIIIKNGVKDSIEYLIDKYIERPVPTQ